MLTILTPPFQVPDEQQHFFRAYQLSSLELAATVRHGESGGVLPSSLPELAEGFLGSREIHGERKLRPFPLSDTLQALRTPLDPERREFTDFFGAAFYSPAPYLPQAAAIAAGRALGVGPLGLLYMGRLANGLVAVLLVAAALRAIPAGALALSVFGLLPMTLYVFASVSPDAGVIGTALFFTALCLRARVSGLWTTWDVVAASLAAAVFCSVKPVYVPLLVLGLPFGRRAANLLAYAVIVSVGLGATIGWIRYASPLIIFPEGADPAAQVGRIVSEPFWYLGVLCASVTVLAPYWGRQMIGVLGWLNLYLRLPLYLVPLVAWALTAVLPRGKRWQPHFLECCWYVILGLASTVLISTTLYVYSNVVGQPFIKGVQGRYFLPLAGIAAVVLESRVPLRGLSYRLVFLSVLALMSAEVAATELEVANTFELFK